MTRLVLHLFGWPRLIHLGQPYELRLRKGVALLAYLATEGYGASRDVLATMLWPEFDQVRARTNLRRTIFRLNQTPFSAWLEADYEWITLHITADDTIDVTAFDDLLEQANPEALAEAVALYEDDFLGSFDLPDSAPFAEWASTQRESYRRRVLNTLHDLARHYLSGNDFAAAEAAAHRQLALDDLREGAWRQLIEALAAAGRRGEALMTYERCRQQLFDELGVEPAPETVALAESIRTLAGPSSLATIPTDGVSASPAAPHQAEAGHPLPEILPIPYRGLFPFREEDAPYYFGREEITELLVGAVHQQSIVALIGPSGSGKSSVVHAGLLAEMRPAQRWIVASFRPGNHPFYALAEALLPYLEPNLRAADTLIEVRKLAYALSGEQISLMEVIARILQGQNGAGRFLLVSDQFEELYTQVSANGHQEHFLETLLEPVFLHQYRPDPAFCLVLTVRADFLGQALAYRPMADAIQESDVKLGPMSRPELGRAIVNPARLHGVEFDPGLADRLLDDVGQEPGRLPLLEFSLTLLWEQRQNRKLTHEAYEAIGRVDGALAQYAEDVYITLGEETQASARRIFIQLVRPGIGTEDTRRLSTREELGDADWGVVQRLADARLVVTGHNALGEESVEVVHEALLQNWARLRGWMSEDRAFRIWQERLRAAVQTWEAADQDEGALLGGVALATAEDWLAENPAKISPSEEAFIKASAVLGQRRRQEEQRARQERERLRRRLVRVLAAGLLLATLLALIAMLQWRSAQDARDETRSRELALAARQSLEEDAERAILLALQALSVTHTPEAEQVLHQAVMADRLLLRLGNDAVQALALAYSPDGDHLAATYWPGADQPQTTVVWDAVSGDPLLTLTPPYSIEDLAFSADGSLLATAGTAGATMPPLHFWDVATGDERQELHLYDEKDNPPCTYVFGELSPGIYRLDVSPDGARLATVACAGGVLSATVWDVETGREIFTLPDYQAPGDARPAIRFSPDGALLATNTLGGKVALWKANSGEPVRFLDHTGGQRDVADLAFSPDGTRLVSAGPDGYARIWDTGSGDELLAIDSGSPELWAVAFDSEGTRLVTGDVQGTSKIWDATSGRQLLLLSGAGERVWQAAFSPDGQRLATTDLSGDALVWDLGPVSEFFAQMGETAFEEVLFSPDGKRIAATDAAGIVRLWDAAAGRELLRWQAHEAVIEGFAFSPDGSMLATGSADKQVKLWEAATGKLLFELTGYGNAVAAAAFSPDGIHLAAGDLDGLLAVWDTRDGQKVYTTTLPAGLTAGVAYSPAGDRLAVALQSSPQVAILLDSTSGEELLLLEDERFGDGGYVLDFSPDGERLAVASFGGLVTVFTVADGAPLLNINAHDGPIWGMAFDPAGTRLATSSVDGTVKLWDAGTGRLLLTLGSFEVPVAGVDFDPDGDRLVTASYDNAVRGFVLPLEEMVTLARSRLSRTFTGEECRQYRIDPCPGLP